MNQNYNNPVFILDESLLGENAASDAALQFKEAYPNFNEAFKFIMYGGRAIVKRGATYSLTACRFLEVVPGIGGGGEVLLQYTDNADTAYEALVTYAAIDGGGVEGGGGNGGGGGFG